MKFVNNVYIPELHFKIHFNPWYFFETGLLTKDNNVGLFQHATFAYINQILQKDEFTKEEKLSVQKEALKNMQVI